MVNAFIDAEDMVFPSFVDMSVAVSTPKGLVTPILRNAETMALHEIELTLASLAAKAREGKLTLEEMSGGTFTVSNGGKKRSERKKRV